MSARTHYGPAMAVAPHPLRLAMEARDHAAFVAALSPDVVLRSPASARPFVGRTEVADLMRPLIAAFERWECRYELADGERHVLAVSARISGRDVELLEELVHDANGRVRELRLHGRPLDGLAAFAKVAGPPLARRRGRSSALAARLLTRPLPALLAGGDGFVTRLAGR